MLALVRGLFRIPARNKLEHFLVAVRRRTRWTLQDEVVAVLAPEFGELDREWFEETLFMCWPAMEPALTLAHVPLPKLSRSLKAFPHCLVFVADFTLVFLAGPVTSRFSDSI